jgi:thymidylate kinase
LHCLYDVGAIEPDYRYRLHQLSGHALRDGPFLRCLDGKLPEGWDADHVVRSIREQQWSTLEQLPLVSRDGGERRHRTSVGSALRRGAFMMRRAQYRLRRPGLSLALLGPDGAGKSTLAEDVRARFLFPVQVIYMGNRPQSPLHIGAIAIPGSSLFRRLLRIWMNMGRAIYHRSLGRLVIFDRYTYDQSRELSDDASMVERAYFWMLTHSTPAPDRVFILDAPGQVMYDRKGEWSPYELEVQRAHFLSLRDRLANVEVVDASRDPTAMRRDVLDRIWRQYVSRWAP